MKIEKYSSTSANGHALYEVTVGKEFRILHHGTWGITEVIGVNENSEKLGEPSKEELPKLVQKYIDEYIEPELLEAEKK